MCKKTWLVLGVLLASSSSPVGAQPSAVSRPKAVHRLYRGDDPPGAIGSRQLLRGGPFLGHLQPVRIVVPRGAAFAVSQGNAFGELSEFDTIHGLMVGSVYRLCVWNVPGHEGTEFYPSIELIDGLQPPPGKEVDYPLTIAFDQDDFDAAAVGNWILRTVFVENPSNPVILPESTAIQEVFDVREGEDPLHVADELGRPVAIVRLGDIQPPTGEQDSAFYFGDPPVQFLAVQESFSEEVGPTFEVAPTQCVVEDEGDLSHPCPDADGSKPRRDEYLCDGDDTGPQARLLADDSWRGLEREETVATFRTSDGQAHVVASNRACIYSPRVAATRRISRLVEAESVDRPGGVDTADVAWIADRPLPALDIRDRVVLDRQVRAKLVHGLQDRQPGLLVDQTWALEEAVDRVIPLEHLRAMVASESSQVDRFAIAEAQQNYEVWTIEQAAEVILDDQVAIEQTGVRGANEKIVYEAEGGARLLLKKLASRQDAPLGELVDFTIRFDNVGNEPIHAVEIVDHLTPRLEYVDASATSTVRAEFAAEHASEEALLLRWKLRDELPPGSGGSVSFQCRVR